jgi:hypothetical protein
MVYEEQDLSSDLGRLWCVLVHFFVAIEKYLRPRNL